MNGPRARALVLLAVLPSLAWPAPPRVDHVGDPLPERAVARVGTVRLRHGGPITALAFSPDGKTLVSAGEDARISLWDVATGKELQRLEASSGITALACTADGKLLLARAGLGPARRWDLATGRELLGSTRRPTSDEERVLADKKREAERKVALLFDSEKPTGVPLALSPSGDLVALGEYFGTGLTVWDLERRRERGNCVGHVRKVKAAAFSPDGKIVASGGEDHTIRLWRVRSGKQRLIFPGPQGSEFCCRLLGEEGTSLVVGEDARLSFINAATGQQRETMLHRHLGPLLEVSHDGRLAIFGKGNGRVYLVDLARQVILHKLIPPREVAGWAARAAFTPDGTGLLLVTADASTGRGSEAGHRLSLWDIAEGEMVRAFDAAGPKIAGPFSIAPDGRQVILGVTRPTHDEPEVRVWDFSSGRDLSPEFPFLASRRQGCFSPDGHFLVGWDTGRRKRQTLMQLIEEEERGPRPEDAGGIRLWERGTGQHGEPLTVAAGEIPTTLAFTHTGRFLAVGLENGGIILHDLAAGKDVARLRGHRGEVRSLAFSRCGRRLVSSSADVTALVWDVADLTHPQPFSEPTRAQLRGWWKDLASADATVAMRAVGGLATAPKETLPFLETVLRPVPVVSPEKVARLIENLDSRRFADRAAALRELAALEKTAEYPLRMALEGEPPLEVRRRLEHLLSAIQGPERSLDRQRILRALLALRYMNTDVARRHLVRLSRGAEGAWMTEQARAALER